MKSNLSNKEISFAIRSIVTRECDKDNALIANGIITTDLVETAKAVLDCVALTTEDFNPYKAAILATSRSYKPFATILGLLGQPADVVIDYIDVDRREFEGVKDSNWSLSIDLFNAMRNSQCTLYPYATGIGIPAFAKMLEALTSWLIPGSSGIVFEKHGNAWLTGHGMTNGYVPFYGYYVEALTVCSPNYCGNVGVALDKSRESLEKILINQGGTSSTGWSERSITSAIQFLNWLEACYEEAQATGFLGANNPAYASELERIAAATKRAEYLAECAKKYDAKTSKSHK